MTNRVVLTYRYRLKCKHAKDLNRMAGAVNCVWNYCNEAQRHTVQWNKQWLSGFDLTYLTAGAYKEFGLSANTISQICQKFDKSRRVSRKPWLRFRGKKSLGWVPFRGRDTRFVEGGFLYYGKVYSVWRSRELPDNAKIKDGSSFSQDARGRWYLNVVVEVDVQPSGATGEIGIDLGLKSLATLSDGAVIDAPMHFRTQQERLAKAQRARKKRRIRSVHTKIAAQRRDHLHKISTNIVRQYNEIYVGNVNASGLAKTKMAKSVLDAGWSSLRFYLQYKSIANGGTYSEVNEAYSTMTCSECGSLSGPKGRQGLVIRQWTCDCGASHDRDVNAARNIARLGHETRLAEAA